MNVLFIDDHPEFLHEMAEQLQDHGNTVTRCLRADDAVRALGKIDEYDIVILDIMMRLGTLIAPSEADETGIAIYRRLRKVAPDMVVLVISAMSKDRFWQTSGFAEDPNAVYFGKPLKAEDRISQLVERAVSK